MKLKKALLGLLALAAGLPMSTSCSDDNDRILPYEYIAVQVDKDGSWSFYGPDGEVLLKDEFKNRPRTLSMAISLFRKAKKSCSPSTNLTRRNPKLLPRASNT